MKAKCRSRWTAAEDELFHRMIEMKVPAETIALQLRRSVDELRVRAYVIGLPLKWFKPTAALQCNREAIR